MNSATTRLAIVGFPKCGTSALARALGDSPSVRLMLRPDGQIEVTWPLIKELELAETDDSETAVVVHKWTAYIFNEAAMEHLATDPSRRFVLCVRSPLKALVSWHNMHRRIAAEGRLKTHFAYKNRDFYLNCTVDEYFETFAAPRLEYDRHFARLVSIAGADRVLVLSQERMAENMDAAVAVCRAFSGFATSADPEGTAKPHVAYADRAEAEVSPSIQEQLRLVQQRLDTAIADSGVRALL